MKGERERERGGKKKNKSQHHHNTHLKSFQKVQKDMKTGYFITRGKEEYFSFFFFFFWEVVERLEGVFGNSVAMDELCAAIKISKGVRGWNSAHGSTINQKKNK